MIATEKQSFHRPAEIFDSVSSPTRLAVLAEVEGCPNQGELSRRVGRSASGVSLALARLCANGLVTRRRSDFDGRSTVYTLTPAGRALLALARSLAEDAP